MDCQPVPCPCCGYCPTCGRRNYVGPIWQYQPFPAAPWPTWFEPPYTVTVTDIPAWQTTNLPERFAVRTNY